ncbi:MAG: hypothetical protein ACOVQA_11375 [Thermoflexibacteraceae bacterium]|jgi:hypothetical protein
MKKTLLSLCCVSLLWACAEDEKTITNKVERVFRQQMKDQLGLECTTVKINKEKDKQYFIEADVAGNPPSHIQAIFLGEPEEGKFNIQETLNSVTGRYVQDFVGVQCTDVVLKQKDSVYYDGKITLKTGEKLNLIVHKDNGWYPENDTATLGVLVKRSIAKGQRWKSVAIRMIPLSKFEYHAVVDGDSGKYAVLKIAHTGTAFNFKEVPNPQEVLAAIEKQTQTGSQAPKK